ncbi:protein GrpE [Lentilactobacillus sunkii]|uniref:Protein GrpE n=1 Tax=Lentilactobacillus sunkii TaxID=481719 RepID=A0A1E7XDM4_9LACO|nr:nucleotide exchange factor GrpE [Lentilactobacillus sunkii]OFA11215.1 protein GrpE [Lentilactobacillus sunkii]
MADSKDDSVKKNQSGPTQDKSVEAGKAVKDSAKHGKEADKTKSRDSDDTKKLKQTVVELQKKLDAMEDKFLRAEADMRNIETHAKKEQADLIKYDGQQLAHDILPIVDNLQRALKVDVTDEGGKQLKQGVSMVYKHFNKALSDNGVEVIDALNKPFDPKFDQAVQTSPADDDHPADTVVQVLQDGYRLKDRVLRPAMVVVAK